MKLPEEIATGPLCLCTYSMDDIWEENPEGFTHCMVVAFLNYKPTHNDLLCYFRADLQEEEWQHDLDPSWENDKLIVEEILRSEAEVLLKFGKVGFCTYSERWKKTHKSIPNPRTHVIEWHDIHTTAPIPIELEINDRIMTAYRWNESEDWTIEIQCFLDLERSDYVEDCYWAYLPEGPFSEDED